MTKVKENTLKNIISAIPVKQILEHKKLSELLEDVAFDDVKDCYNIEEMKDCFNADEAEEINPSPELSSFDDKEMVEHLRGNGYLISDDIGQLVLSYDLTKLNNSLNIEVFQDTLSEKLKTHGLLALQNIIETL